MKPASAVHDEVSASQLLERFRSGFRFKLALTEEERRKAYRLRHRVYCEELEYEEPADAGLEFDRHDEYSLHCLIEHRRSGEVAGCMRLVLPADDEPSRDRRLPLQSYANQSLTHALLHPATLSRDEICEVSRLAIAPPFRRKSVASELEESLQADLGQFTADERRTFPIIVVGLFLATYALVGLTQRRHVFAMMEPRLPRLLSRSGFHFTRVGDAIDFHGKRSAFYIDLHKAEKEIHADLLPLYEHVKSELAAQADVDSGSRSLVAAK